MTATLCGLVLAGGHSRRMQRDKAGLEYDGRSQLARAVELLTPLVTRCFVSVRGDQRQEPQRAAYPTIADRIPELGPIGGIHAAQQERPQAAWLVLACDLPFLDAATLQQLIAARAPQRLATAFRSSHDGKPEPLCAIYEPASAAAITAWIAAGNKCPRNFLAQADVTLLELKAPAALDNINTPEEYQQAHARLGAGGPRAVRALKVRYFALLREQAGRGEESLESAAATPRELYAELQTRRGLKLAPEFLRVAVNDDFGSWSQPLAAGDTVAFLPPVAGG
ncbi:MAG: NTP transferase domain-containing protein [Gammaproteobacteria bacterium]|nr:NTP transferase domain-containing protein [Gammaproteobacteria bacterium]